MKSLIIVRHAKSSWDASVPNDIDRPLNDRGKEDAPKAAERLLKKGIKIDTFISSPAKRAKKTAKYFIEAYGKHKDKIIIHPALYEAHVSAFYDVVKNLEDSSQHVALFSHNPGITEFANSLTDTRIDDMPTCSVFAIKLSSVKWADFETAVKTFWFFDFPKLH